MHRTLIPILVLGALSVAARASTPGDSELQESVDARYPGFRLPPEDGTHRHRIQGDFDGDEVPDVAAILQGDGEWRAVAFVSAGQARHTLHGLGGFPGSNAQFRKSHGSDEIALELLEAGQPLSLLGAPTPGTRHPRAHFVIHLPHEVPGVVHYRWDATQARFLAIGHLTGHHHE